jgi:hypothetical protein
MEVDGNFVPAPEVRSVCNMVVHCMSWVIGFSVQFFVIQACWPQLVCCFILFIMLWHALSVYNK